MSEKDRETRERVLEAATRLFAANGFKKVTVREICQEAHANVAAVNYHFGDKLGLYRNVLDRAIEPMRATSEAAKQAGDGRPPEEKLRAYIRVFLERVVAHGQDTWIHQLMAHEIANPTAALDMVIDQVIRPRLAYISEVVAGMLGRAPDDDEVLRCALSVQAQCHGVMKNAMLQRVVPELGRDALSVDLLAEHIAEFSIGGIKSLRLRSAVGVR